MIEPVFQKPIVKRQTILGTVPSKSNCYKIITFKSKQGASHASLAKTKQLKQYENDFYIQCNLYRNANIQGYFQFDADVYYPNQRSDLDNSAKVLLDCLQKIGAFPNDNKLVCLRMNKFLDKLNPRVEFTITPVMLELPLNITEIQSEQIRKLSEKVQDELIDEDVWHQKHWALNEPKR